MTMLTSPPPHTTPHTGSRALPRRGNHHDDSVGQTITSTVDVLAALRRSNHATAFAGWIVATIAMGLVLQVDTVRAIGSAPATLLLVGLLLPVLAAVGRVTMLLWRAAEAATHAGAVVGGECLSTGAVAGVPSASDRLNELITITQVRNSLAQHALTWAYGSGIAFLAWSLLAAVLSAGG